MCKNVSQLDDLFFDFNFEEGLFVVGVFQGMQEVFQRILVNVGGFIFCFIFLGGIKIFFGFFIWEVSIYKFLICKWVFVLELQEFSLYINFFCINKFYYMNKDFEGGFS